MSTQTVITASTHIRGAITGDDDLKVDGQVEGNIRLEGDLNLDAEGRIIGNIDAHDVQIDGAVKGNITASKHLTLSKTARVQGDLVAPAIVIIDGALVRGDVDIGSASNQSSKPKKTTKKQAPPLVAEETELPEGTVGRKVKVKKSS